MKKTIWIILIVVLFYTRFVNLSWGLPYPFHPDERNMAVAAMQLKCESVFDLRECLNPHFFAYGQFPLYAASIVSHGIHFFSFQPGVVSFHDVILALRTISALAAVATVLVLEKIITHLRGKKSSLVSFACFIFVPGFIQFSHFGTTESLIMLGVSLLTYFSLKIMQGENKEKYIMYAGIVGGLALATKVSTILFLAFPIIALFYHFRKIDARLLFVSGVRYAGILLIVFILFSPQNFISFYDFLGSMRYEGDVGIGAIVPFYTRQFLFEQPILFQFQRIFPYALGWPFFILSVVGIFVLSWKDKQLMFLRIAILLSFLPVAFVFAKWTRFIAPVFPLSMLFAVFLILKLSDEVHLFFKKQKTWIPIMIVWIFVFVCCVPGIAYLSVYQREDVRFAASRWMQQNIPENAAILSETANVVDLPILVPGTLDGQWMKQYRMNSFNFYELDNDPQLPDELSTAIQDADYIVVPSRRIFKNLTCEVGEYYGAASIGSYLPSIKKCQKLKEMFPLVNYYYHNLFAQSEAERQGISLTQTFTSFPRIELFGKTLVEFPDEEAEESWTVFDHPVIRIYKKNTL